MADKYLKNVIKDYTYWTVYLAENQCYLGKCVIWCKRKDALDITETTTEERQELFTILYVMKNVLTKAFKPDWFNYTFLGNETRHLHGHLVPRYANSKKFADKIFTDILYGHHYKIDKDFTVPRSTFVKIKTKLKNAFKELKEESEDKLLKAIKKAEKGPMYREDIRELLKKIK